MELNFEEVLDVENALCKMAEICSDANSQASCIDFRKLEQMFQDLRFKMEKVESESNIVHVAKVELVVKEVKQ